MTHPYRVRPPAPSAPPPAPDGLGAPSMMFGLICALAGQALAGPGCALVATLLGVFLLVAPGRRNDGGR